MLFVEQLVIKIKEIINKIDLRTFIFIIIFIYFVLKIELNQIDIVWEVARDGDLFPHLYDHLPLSSVVADYELKRSPSGDHIIPDDCLYQR